KQERPPYPFESYHDQWINYCAYDCKALYDVLGIFIKTITDLGGSIGYTIASTAMKTFRLNYLKSHGIRRAASANGARSFGPDRGAGGKGVGAYGE
ncbi:MAG: hypothetical protein R6W89_07255, partial [Candidatus Hydrogenedentota bacterium]